MRRRAVLLLATLLAVLALGTGCGNVLREASRPDCAGDLAVGPLVLSAQAVPTAERVPCISSLPAGWSFARFQARNGQARFILDSDRGGTSSVKVTLTEKCDLADATEIPSDELGTRRYERVDKVAGGLAGARIYQYPGGCTTYDIELPEHGSALVNEISVALGFMTRVDVAKELARLSEGFEKL